jgi:hypothetical protein
MREFVRRAIVVYVDYEKRCGKPSIGNIEFDDFIID